LKIEGRLKDENYVKNVLAAYNLALNRIIAMNPDRYCRASHGVVDYTFSPDLSNSFNRGYTDYFLNNRQPAKGSLASFATPKWVGREVATVRRQLSNRLLLADVKMPLANGDGLGFFDAAGKFCGFRLNRVERDKLHTATDVSIPSGTTIYRNFDKQWNDDMDRTTAHRKLPVDMHLAWNAEKNALILAMSLTSSDYVASASVACECVPAKVPQSDNRKRVLSKLGDTIFTLNALIDDVVECFVPASVLTSLRREAVDALLLTIEATYKFQRRQPNVLKSDALADKVVTRHDNIANHLAEQVYREAGVSCNKMPMAIEVAKPVERELRVMQSRYCIRREMGACLKTAGAKSLPSPLFITSGSSRFRLDFECGKCQMNVIALR
jgi:putative protease